MSRHWIAAAGIALLLGTCGCDVAAPPPINSIHAIDQAKLAAVEVTLKHNDPVLAGCDIKVSAQNDLCVLDGKVPTEEAKAKAEALAKTVEGISRVANHLIVVPEEQPQPSSSDGP